MSPIPLIRRGGNELLGEEGEERLPGKTAGRTEWHTGETLQGGGKIKHGAGFVIQGRVFGDHLKCLLPTLQHEKVHWLGQDHGLR